MNNGSDLIGQKNIMPFVCNLWDNGKIRIVKRNWVLKMNAKATLEMLPAVDDEGRKF
jgi:hypothetical protein